MVTLHTPLHPPFSPQPAPSSARVCLVTPNAELLAGAMLVDGDTVTMRISNANLDAWKEVIESRMEPGSASADSYADDDGEASQSSGSDADGGGGGGGDGDGAVVADDAQASGDGSLDGEAGANDGEGNPGGGGSEAGGEAGSGDADEIAPAISRESWLSSFLEPDEDDDDEEYFLVVTQRGEVIRCEHFPVRNLGVVCVWPLSRTTLMVTLVVMPL